MRSSPKGIRKITGERVEVASTCDKVKRNCRVPSARWEDDEVAGQTTKSTN